MNASSQAARAAWLPRHAVLVYFLLTFAVSWLAAFAVMAPKLIHQQPLSRIDGLLMFPAILLGPPVTGILLTGLLQGRAGLRMLLRRMVQIRFSSGWWLALLIPPTLVLLTLFVLNVDLSPAFTPGFFPKGVLFGCLAGFLEEIGWTGFVFPLMARRGHPFRAAVFLGLLWGVWHLPVIDFLGVASPHRAALPAFVVVFIGTMIAVRVLIARLYAGTHSIALAQLMHACSTASLVLFSPAMITPMQEVLWYAIYATLLWIAVLLICIRWPMPRL